MHTEDRLVWCRYTKYTMNLFIPICREPIGITTGMPRWEHTGSQVKTMKSENKYGSYLGPTWECLSVHAQVYPT